MLKIIERGLHSRILEAGQILFPHLFRLIPIEIVKRTATAQLLSLHWFVKWRIEKHTWRKPSFLQSVWPFSHVFFLELKKAFDNAMLPEARRTLRFCGLLARHGVVGLSSWSSKACILPPLCRSKLLHHLSLFHCIAVPCPKPSRFGLRALFVFFRRPELPCAE